MHLVVGLGNPGSEYAGSRHNLGFQVVEALSRDLSAGRPYHRNRSLCTKARIAAEELILVQPLTYMNRSGRAVAELVKYYGIEPRKLILIYDDLDLPPGALRIRFGGGSAGHRGVESVLVALGTRDFIRVRIGIGKPDEGLETADYVLEPLNAVERTCLDQAVQQASLAVNCIIGESLEIAMNKFNGTLQC